MKQPLLALAIGFGLGILLMFEGAYPGGISKLIYGVVWYVYG